MDDLIPLAAVSLPFLMVIAIVVIPAWLKSRERREIQRTVRAAIERGQPLPPEVVDSFSRDAVKAPATAQRDLRTGVIWLAVGLGVAAFSLIEDAEIDADGVVVDLGGGLLGLSMIPIVIGLAFIVLSIFNKNRG